MTEIPPISPGIYCDSPAGLRLDDTGGAPSSTLDFMAVDNGIRVDSLDLGFPTIREAVAPHPTIDGNYDYTSLFGPRVVTVTGSFLPSANYTDRQTMMQALAGWCAPNLRPQLVYAIDATSPTLVLVVRGSQFSAPASDRRISAFTVSWVAPDPAATAFVAKEVAIAAGETAEVVNAGTYTAWPTFTIAGPCTDPVLEWRDGAVTFAGLELRRGETVVVEPKARRAGSRYRNLDFARTRWRGLPPGMTEVRASAAVTVAWRDTYI